MKSEGTFVMHGGGFGGDHKTPLPVTKLRQRPPVKPSPTQLRFPPSESKPVRRPSRRGVSLGARPDDWDNPLLTPQNVVDRIIELYTDGMSANDVAKCTGVAKSTVLRHLKFNEIPIRGSVKDLDTETIKKMSADGDSIRSIARFFGVAPMTIRSRLR